MLKYAVPLLIVLGLAGCAHRADPVALQKAVDLLDQAVLDGNKAPESALNAYEALYAKYRTDPIAIGGYVDALRRTGRQQGGDPVAPAY